MRLRRISAAAVAVALASLAVAPGVARAITPDIVNDATANRWLESFAFSGEGGAGNRASVTLVVRHDPGKRVTGLYVDDDWDGDFDANDLRSVTSEQPGYDFNYSRVTYAWAPSTSGTGIDCGFLSGTRRVDRPLRVRARLNDGSETDVVSSSVRMVANGQCTGPEDYPFIYNQSQTPGTERITPGTTVAFTFTGDDPDSGIGGCLSFDGINWRMRNLTTGAVTTPQRFADGIGDNTPTTLNVTFNQRGRWVVEAEAFCDDNNNVNAGHWWYLGAVDVNSPSDDAPSGSISAPRPHIGETINAVASVSDSDSGGRVQVIEWDVDNNGVFERRDIADDETAGLTLAQRTASLNTTGLPPGQHTIRARITDNGAINGADTIRRTAIISTNVLIDSPPVANNQTVTTEGTTPRSITLTSSDADGDPRTYSIVDAPDHGSVSGGTGAARTYTADADFAGRDQFTFRADDGFSGTDDAVVTINVQPNTTLDPIAPDPTRFASITADFASPQAPSGGISFECSLDGGAYEPCTSGQLFGGLAQGTHTLAVRAVKALTGGGTLTDPTPAQRSFDVDLTKPTTTLTGTPPAFTQATSASFDFIGADDFSGLDRLECRLDDGEWTTCTTGQSYSGLEDGRHSFDVRAIDEAGNVDAPERYEWTVDTAVPTTAITQKPPALTNSTAAALHFVSGEPGATFECQLDGGGWSACTSPQNVTHSGPSGSRTFEVRARDAAGNVDGTPDSWTWTVDLDAPDTQIDDGPADPTEATSAEFAFSSPGDPTAAFQCSVDGGPWETCASPKELTGLALGDHSFKVRAVDAAGNVDQTESTETWTVHDDTSPAIVFTGGIPDGDERTSPEATFSFTSDEPDATYRCKLDGGEWIDPCLSPQSFSNLALGAHTFTVEATDAAATPAARTATASRSWTVVDRTAPEVEITGGPTGTRATRTATFRWRSPAQDVVSYECRVYAGATPSGAWSPCGTLTEPAQTVTVGADGPHTFEVRARDGASPPNVSLAAARTWSVDTTPPPDVRIDQAPPASTTERSAAFRFSSSEGGVDFECVIDGVADACGAAPTFAGLTLGAHQLEVRAVDAAGNRSGPVSATWTVVQPEVTNTPQPTPTPTPTPQPQTPQQPNTPQATCTFARLSNACRRPTLTGTIKGTGSRSAVSAVLSGGGVELSSATFTLSSGATFALPSKSLGKRTGRFTLTDRAGRATRRLNLTLPRRAAGKLVLLSTAGLTVTLDRGKRQIVVTGLPAGVTGVHIALDGKNTGLVVRPKNCAPLRWSGVLVDRARGRGSVTSRPVACRSRGRAG